MNTEREFCPTASRYVYDSKYCVSKGWAQFDTKEDAPYYGQWVNPFELKFASYCEGDLSVTTCDAQDEFVAYIQSIADWHGNGFIGIDTGFGVPNSIGEKLTEIGLGHLLHKSYFFDLDGEPRQHRKTDDSCEV